MIHTEDDSCVRNSPRPAKMPKRDAGTPVPSGVAKLHADTGYNKELVAERQAAYKLIQGLPRLPELDYAPTTPIEQGLEKMWAWYRSREESRR